MAFNPNWGKSLTRNGGQASAPRPRGSDSRGGLEQGSGRGNHGTDRAGDRGSVPRGGEYSSQSGRGQGGSAPRGRGYNSQSGRGQDSFAPRGRGYVSQGGRGQCGSTTRGGGYDSQGGRIQGEPANIVSGRDSSRGGGQGSASGASRHNNPVDPRQDSRRDDAASDRGGGRGSAPSASGYDGTVDPGPENGRSDAGNDRDGGEGDGRENFSSQSEAHRASSPDMQKADIKTLSISEPPLPPRPAYGTQGSTVLLRTNYFHLLPSPNQKIYKYRVGIDDRVPGERISARKRRRILTLLLREPLFRDLGHGVATDYADIVLSSRPINLPEGHKELVLPFSDDDETPLHQGGQVYNVRIEPNRPATVAIPELLAYLASTYRDAAFDLKADTLQALNIIMARTANTNANVVPGGRNKFYSILKHASIDLLGGVVALRGYYTSVRTSILRVLVNMNVCTSAFYMSGPLRDLMKAFYKANGVPEDSIQARHARPLESFLKKLRVTTNYLKNDNGILVKKVKTIHGLAKGRNLQYLDATHIFAWERPDSTQQISVQKYYLAKYEITLKHPRSPLVNVSGGNRAVYVPMELCTVLPGQMLRRKFSAEQTRAMTTKACRVPEDSVGLIINEGAGIMGIKTQVHPNLNAFGLSVKPEMVKVNGRILPAPKVEYGKRALTVEQGAWNMRGQKFAAPTVLSQWSFLKITSQNFREKEQVKNIGQDAIQAFQRTVNSYGMGCEHPRPLEGYEINLGFNEDANDNKLKEVLGLISSPNKSIRILLVILPNKDAPTYARIKFWADVKFGIHTVCVQADKFKNKRPDYFANVALKFNLKLGGINHTLPADKIGIIKDGRTMVVGIDVTHPSPGSVEGAPSIAGVVASIDATLAQWPASIRVQTGRQEMVADLEGMIHDRLLLWYTKNNGNLPDKILVYRDGVSEGQYNDVLETELNAIQKAVKTIYPPTVKAPKISIIIVGKRHHTRFYPLPGTQCGPNGNPLNGTIVDREITMERGWDFFLQAHGCIKGTARPAHYVVIYDKIGLGVDELEQLTHNLCYLFGRATKAVSICPPAYLADLLCERGRCYLNMALSTADSASTTSGNPYNWQSGPWTGGVHDKLKDSMFYI